MAHSMSRIRGWEGEEQQAVLQVHNKPAPPSLAEGLNSRHLVTLLEGALAHFVLLAAAADLYTEGGRGGGCWKRVWGGGTRALP